MKLDPNAVPAWCLAALLSIWACSPEAADAPADPSSNATAPRSPSDQPTAGAPAVAQQAPSATPGGGTLAPTTPTTAPFLSEDWTVLALVSELRATPTARVWASGDPARMTSLELNDVDPFYEMPPVFGVAPFWCLRSIRVDSLPEGITRRRYFLFYRDRPSPPPPDALSLPNFSPGIDYQLSNCSLRMVASEVRGADPLAVLDEWRRAHERAFGASTAIAASSLPYGLREEGRSTWTDGDLVAASGMGVTGAPIALAMLPTPDLRGSEQAPNPSGDRYRGTLTWRSTLLDLALEAAEVRSDTRADIETIRRGTPAQPPDRDLVLSVLRQLLERPQRMESGDPATERYAARLSLADILLSRHYRYIPLPQQPGLGSPREATQAAAIAFNELGANYRYTELEYETMYFGAFADSAAALPSTPGGWGDLGRVAGLEDGCNWDPTLEATEELLPVVTQPQLRARLHYLRAEALASILAFHHLKQLRPGVVDDIEGLRREALDHYRAALEGDLNAEDELVARAMAWRVAMNEPIDPRYDCRRA